MNNKENNQLEISLHYYFEDKGLHQLDAIIHNKCEKYFLMALKQLFSYYHDCPIDVRIHKEGGFIDEYLPQIKDWLFDENIRDTINNLLSAFGGYYFSKKTNRLTDIKTRSEILADFKSQIREGSLSESEAMILVSKDRILKKLMKAFFKELKNESRATAIEFKHYISNQQHDSHLLDIKDSIRDNSVGFKRITQYRVNDEFFDSMREAVKRCFEIFIKDHPNMTAESIINAWLSLGIKVPNFIEDEATFNRRANRSKDTNSDVFTLNNGEHIYTSNHYSFKNFCSFMDKVNAKNWGIHIDII